MKFYEAQMLSGPEIKPTEVERFTDNSVWINGNRRARISEYKSYFPTWEGAYQHLSKVLDRREEAAELKLNRIRRQIDVLQDMTPPDGE